MLSIWHQHIHSFYLIYLCWTKPTAIHTTFSYSWILITNRMNSSFHCWYYRYSWVLSIYVGLYEYLRVLRVFVGIAGICGYCGYSRVFAGNTGICGYSRVFIDICEYFGCQSWGIWVLRNDCRCNQFHIHNYLFQNQGIWVLFSCHLEPISGLAFSY